MKRAAAVAVGLLGIGLAAWLLWPRPVDDEAQVRAALAEMAERAAGKDVSGILEHVSDSYRGEGGDKRELKTYLLGYLMRSGVVAVVLTRVEVAVEGERARADLTALLARSPARNAGELSREELVGAHRIEADFAKEGGRWLVTGATRRDAAPGELLR